MTPLVTERSMSSGGPRRYLNGLRTSRTARERERDFANPIDIRVGKAILIGRYGALSRATPSPPTARCRAAGGQAGARGRAALLW